MRAMRPSASLLAFDSAANATRPALRRAMTLMRGAWGALLLIVLPALGAPTDKPNILILLADDLGYSDIGCYGGEIETPTIDALAREGLRFTQFYNSARCWPTRAALLSGYYPQEVRRDLAPGLSTGKGERQAWARLLPEMLAPLGYRSYHSGKWHIDGEPIENGFDRSYHLGDQERYFSPQIHNEDGKRLPPVKRDSGYYATEAVADRAIGYLREHWSERAEQPFFAYVAFTAPHFPLQAKPEDIEHVGRRYEAGWDRIRAQRWERIRQLGLTPGELSPVERELGPPYAWPGTWETVGYQEVFLSPPWDVLSAAQREHQITKMTLHAAMIERMDREIGRIVAELRRAGQLENTLIFFLSDNGASSELLVRGDGHDPAAPPGSAGSYLGLGPGWATVANTPFRRHKTWTHEGGIATPLVVHWPRGFEARGELRHAPGHVIDFVPTLLEIAGGSAAAVQKENGRPPFRGVSLVAAFHRDRTIERPLWWHHEGNRALRRGDWKIVSPGPNAPWQLYNLAEDRSETNNLASRHGDLVRELELEWHRLANDITRVAHQD